MFTSTVAAFSRSLKNKGMFSGDSKKPKKSLLASTYGSPKKKAKPKAKATGYRPASKSTSMK